MATWPWRAVWHLSLIAWLRPICLGHVTQFADQGSRASLSIRERRLLIAARRGWAVGRCVAFLNGGKVARSHQQAA